MSLAWHRVHWVVAVYARDQFDENSTLKSDAVPMHYDVVDLDIHTEVNNIDAGVILRCIDFSEFKVKLAAMCLNKYDIMFTLSQHDLKEISEVFS